MVEDEKGDVDVDDDGGNDEGNGGGGTVGWNVDDSSLYVGVIESSESLW